MGNRHVFMTETIEELCAKTGIDREGLKATLERYNGYCDAAYDEEFARVRGVPVRLLYFLLMAMIALSVVMIIQIVGLILVIALLTIPPYIAERFSGSLLTMMLYSILLNILFTWVGLWLSYEFNLTSGASIIMVGGVCFFISFLIGRRRPKQGMT